MSGILPGIPLINNFDANGELMRGALLRLYAAGTNTPVTAYKDSALTAGQEHPWPIQADSAARLPMFYLASGDYRARLSSSDGGYVAYDVPILSAVEPSGGGGGGGGGVSSEVLFQTGYLMQYLGSGVRSGFVRLNGRTIGSTDSSATERANADTQSLYEYLWGEFSDTICPVAGGRGATATADYNANKALTLIDARGRTLFGADGMGASAAGRLTTATFATADSVGTAGGVESITLTASQLPPHTHSGTTNAMNQNASHSHGISGGDYTGTNTGFIAGGGNPAPVGPGRASIQATNTDHAHPFTTNEGDGVSGASHPNVPPGLIVSIYVKL